MPLSTLRDVVLSVQEGRTERALAPVENALEGGVDPVLDALALEAPDVAIIGEVVQPVSYCLAAGREVALERDHVVRSHPQALGQCKGWLAEHLPGAAIVPAISTADAVREAADDADRDARRDRPAARRPPLRRGDAGRGSRGRPGQRDALRLARPHRRRARRRRRAVRRRPRSCSGAWARAPPGWLVSCLAVFAFAGVNLTRIESRPLRRGMGEYMFFLDLEGSAADPAVAGALDGLRRHAELVRVLGSFADRAEVTFPVRWDRYTRQRGNRCTPRTTGVRAARRPPAART